MRARRGWLRVATAMAGLVAAGACGGEKSTTGASPAPVYVDGGPR